MSFDGIVLKSVTEELQASQNARVAKIYQPQATDIIMNLRKKGQQQQLLLSAHPSFARIQYTQHKYENPQTPPMFCMILRKYLEGSLIEDIQQHELERLLTITFRTTDEVGDLSYKQLIIEIMGRHSNIILLDYEKHVILDSIKHISPAYNRYRSILPGRDYIMPPAQDKQQTLDMTPEALLRKIDFNAGKLDRQIVQICQGVSPLIAKEIVHKAGLANIKTLRDAFHAFQQQIIQQAYEPQIVNDHEQKAYFSIMSLTHIDGRRLSFSSISELLDHFYYGKAERDRIRGLAHDMDKRLRNERDKNKRKISKLEKSLIKAEQAQKNQLYGELLTAHMHDVQRGDEAVTVTNYYDENGGTITIPLDSTQTPSENAQRYFRTYNKAKNSVAVTKKQIKQAKQEISYLDRLLQQLDSAAAKDIAEMREELIEEGYLKRKTSKKKKKKANKRPVLDKYKSKDGTDILVGKNNKQNEYLTNRLARPDHLWLHTKDIPGSHVVIRSNDYTEETLKEAAILAAYHSKSKYSSSVPVDYTTIKHVHKPSGAKPGFVTYDHQQTVFVTPHEEDIQAMNRQTSENQST